MRLLHTRTLEFELCLGDSRPDYAILSHTWEPGEVLFEDARHGGKHLRSCKKPGLSKLLMAAQKASDDGLKYIWVDTCCIDKASSAELSEAINSMFRWYRDAAICYAFLSDYRSSSRQKREGGLRSRWFTRGWTLQELIAPDDLEFYDATWKLCGHRIDLSAEVARVTGIDECVLQRHGRKAERCNSSGPVSVWQIDELLLRYGVSTKMSWAARRQTTRPEDIAYCLLGIFDVNMPLLYGEGGTKAFRRLQEEIARRSQDHTLLTWKSINPYSVPGLFADNPSMFRDGHLYRPVRALRGTPISFSNGGVELDVHLAPCTCTMDTDRSTAELLFGGEPIWLAILNCTTEDHFTSPALLLRKTPRLASSFTHHISLFELTGGYRHVLVSSGQSVLYLQSGGRKWSFHQNLRRDHVTP